jgi:hypothetical protein
MSTNTGSSCWITASGSAWLVVASAPTVSSDRPIRPVIGAGTVVKRRLIRAGLQRRAVLGHGGVRLARGRRGVGVFLSRHRLDVRQWAQPAGADLGR